MKTPSWSFITGLTHLQSSTKIRQKKLNHHKNIKNFLKKIIKDLKDLKANDIKFIDIKNRSALGDFLLIVTGNSSRHINAIATKIIENHKKK